MKNDVQIALESEGGRQILQGIAALREKFILEAGKFRADEKIMKRLAKIDAMNDVLKLLSDMSRTVETPDNDPDIGD